ncbi:MAG: NAD(P)H-binding protein, partial [Gemmatimonadaceae bacterium]|nr:NAD(P)H-binding protein [Acetobacteraceae bacterium]
VDFVIARPPMLSDDPETGSVRIVTDGDKAHKITRGDLAQFLVDQLQTDVNIGKRLTVANE